MLSLSVNYNCNNIFIFYIYIMFNNNHPNNGGLVPVSSPPSPALTTGGLNFILHHVSKFDTVAGVAIKYGVEVADIKKLNGLVTDLQMFALKTLQIPLPGRHPPSPTLSNGHDSPQRPSSSEQSTSIRRHSNLFDSFPSLKVNSSSEWKKSPATRNLRGYHDLIAPKKIAAEGFEMAVYEEGGAHYLEDGPFAKSSPISNPPLSRHRKSKSAVNGFGSENLDRIELVLSQETEHSDSEVWIEKLAIRRLKSEADFTARVPEKLLKEDNNGSNVFSAITGKGLALRPKSASRTVSGADCVTGGLNSIPIVGLEDSFTAGRVNGVRKSSSTSSLQDSDNGTLSSIWPTPSKWSLKPDFQALSTATATRPMFDGLPKPMGRRNKAAID